MKKFWRGPAVIGGLVLAALFVPSLTPSAQAVTAPRVPAPARVAKIYPNVAGEGVSRRVDAIRMLNAACTVSAKIKHSRMRLESFDEPEGATATGAAPDIYVANDRFGSAKRASAYVRKDLRRILCLGTPKADPSIVLTRFKAKAGDQAVGFRTDVSGNGTERHWVFVYARKGRVVTETAARSDAVSRPATRPAVRLARLGLKAVHR